MHSIPNKKVIKGDWIDTANNSRAGHAESVAHSTYLSLGHQQEVVTHMEQLRGGLVDGGDYRLVPVDGQMSQRLQQVQGTAAVQTRSGFLCVCV